MRPDVERPCLSLNLIDAIGDYLDATDADRQPFTWTASADSILEEVRRGRVAIAAINDQD